MPQYCMKNFFNTKILFCNSFIQSPSVFVLSLNSFSCYSIIRAVILTLKHSSWNWWNRMVVKKHFSCSEQKLLWNECFIHDCLYIIQNKDMVVNPKWETCLLRVSETRLQQSYWCYALWDVYSRISPFPVGIELKHNTLSDSFFLLFCHSLDPFIIHERITILLLLSQVTSFIS